MAQVKTIYLRNVPDEVSDRLKLLAEQAGMSVNAWVVRELGELSRVAQNAALLDQLPDTGVTSGEVLETLDESRARR